MPSRERYGCGRRAFLGRVGGAVGATGLGLAGAGSALAAPAGGAPRDELRLFGELAIPGARELVAQHGYAYVATGDGMSVVDWRNPKQPEQVGSVAASGSGVMDVKVDGDLATMGHDGGPGISVVDVSDPANPTEVGVYEADGAVHNNFLLGDYAYVGVNNTESTPFDDDHLDVVDVSDPANPTRVGSWYIADHFPDYAAGWVSPLHDLYVQDDRAYLAHWDAGTIVVDVSDPSAPATVTQFGAAPGADEPPAGGFPTQRYLSPPGNAHYVQPSPDGDHVFVGAETFAGSPGGIRVFDATDFGDVEQVWFVEPPAADGLRTSHNFDVTANRLQASWYNGGVRIYDVTDPTAPAEQAHYQPADSFFWTAVRERGFTLASDIDAGMVVLHDDAGTGRSPDFDGGSPPGRPEVDDAR